MDTDDRRRARFITGHDTIRHGGAPRTYLALCLGDKSKPGTAFHPIEDRVVPYPRMGYQHVVPGTRAEFGNHLTLRELLYGEIPVDCN